MKSYNKSSFLALLFLAVFSVGMSNANAKNLPIRNKAKYYNINTTQTKLKATSYTQQADKIHVKVSVTIGPDGKPKVTVTVTF